MDPQKQNLNPDLKQIYEKIMNTPVKPLGQNAPTNPTTTPPPTQTPVTPTATSTPAPLQMSPAPTPVTPPAAAPVMAKAPAPVASPTIPTTPSVPSNQTVNSNLFASVPPRAVGNTAPFVFASGKTQTPKVTTPAPAQGIAPAKKGGISKGILLIPIGLIFLAAYTVFWMAIFGLLDLKALGIGG